MSAGAVWHLLTATMPSPNSVFTFSPIGGKWVQVHEYATPFHPVANPLLRSASLRCQSGCCSPTSIHSSWGAPCLPLFLVERVGASRSFVAVIGHRGGLVFSASIICSFTRSTNQPGGPSCILSGCSNGPLSMTQKNIAKIWHMRRCCAVVGGRKEPASESTSQEVSLPHIAACISGDIRGPSPTMGYIPSRAIALDTSN